MAVDPASSDTIYVGAVNGGVWKRTSGRWKTTTDQFPSLSISALALDPDDSKIVFAGTRNTSSKARIGGGHIGILKSKNGGNDWSLKTKLTMPGGASGTVADFEVHAIVAQASGMKVFAATESRFSTFLTTPSLLVSDDNGVTWKVATDSSGPFPAGLDPCPGLWWAAQREG